MKEYQYKINISIKDYFPKLKKIPYEKYNCIISDNKEKQIISLTNPENKLYQFITKATRKDLTYLIALINTENKKIIGKSNLIIASFRLKLLKDIKNIKYEQQIKLDLNKKIKQNLFGPRINIGNIYLKCIIEIVICINNNIDNIRSNLFMYKIENKNKYNDNMTGNNGFDYNLSNLSLSSFLTNLSTLKENKKQIDKKMKNNFSNNNIKYLCTETQFNQNKNIFSDKEDYNYSQRKMKILSPSKIINLKKYKSKWHINRDYLKTSNSNKNISISEQEKNMNINTSSRIKKVNNIKNNKIRKAFSNENIRKNVPKIRIDTEICNSDTKDIINSKNKKNIKTGRTKPKSGNKYKKIIKSPKVKENNKSQNNIISIINDIKEKNKEIKDKIGENNSFKYSIIKENVLYQNKIRNELLNEYEQNKIKNIIHVNINKKANNILLNKMPKIKIKELNIFKIIFNEIIINKNKIINPKQIIQEKIKQQKQIQILINVIRNLIKIFGNLSHLYENDENKKILLKSLFLRYNIKEKEWNDNDNIIDIYENIIEEKMKTEYHNRYLKEKEEFNTIKEEDEEEMNTIE